MSEEKTYLKGDDFEVTSSKVVVGSTTYALRNIAGTSVNQTNFGWKIATIYAKTFGNFFVAHLPPFLFFNI